MISCIVGKTEITSLSYEDKVLREWSNKHKLICPVCGEELKYYNGEKLIAHFKHLPNSNCIGESYSEKDTNEHNKGKYELFNWLSKQNNISDVKLEYWIPETKQRADIYFEYDNKKYAVEYQCTSSTQIKERTNLYNLNGINVIWILGTENYNELTNDRRTFKELEKNIKRMYGKIRYFDGENMYTLYDILHKFKDKSDKNAIPYKDLFNFKYESKNLNDMNIEDFIIKPMEEFDIFDYVSQKVEQINKNILNEKYKYNVCILSEDETQWGIKLNKEEEIKYSGNLYNIDKTEFEKKLFELKLETDVINANYKIESDCEYIQTSIQQHISDNNFKFKINTLEVDDKIKFIINTTKRNEERDSDIVLVEKSKSEISTTSGFKNECYKELCLHIDKFKELETKLKNIKVKLNDDCYATFNESNYCGEILKYIPFKIKIYDIEFDFEYHYDKDVDDYIEEITHRLLELLNKCFYIYDDMKKSYKYINIDFKIDDIVYGYYGGYHSDDKIYNLYVTIYNEKYINYQCKCTIEDLFNSGYDDILKIINEKLRSFNYDFDTSLIKGKLNDNCYYEFNYSSSTSTYIPLKFKIYDKSFISSMLYCDDLNLINGKSTKILPVLNNLYNYMISKYSNINFNFDTLLDNYNSYLNLKLEYMGHTDKYCVCVKEEIDIKKLYDNIDNFIYKFKNDIIQDCALSLFIDTCKKVRSDNIYNVHYYYDEQSKVCSTDIGVTLNLYNNKITYFNLSYNITMEDFNRMKNIMEFFINKSVKKLKSIRKKTLTWDDINNKK